MPTNSSTSSSALQIPSARRVLLCVGPGGVGKTTVAAALALTAARQGRRVIVVTIDPSRRLAQALGLHRDGAKPGEVVQVPGTAEQGHPLDSLLLDTKEVFDGIVRGYSQTQEIAERMLANPIYRATVEHLGGALEYAATARVHMLFRDNTYDLIVLDTPPTANAIEFLDAPVRINEILNNPAAKFLASSSRVGMKFFGLASSVMLKAFEAMGGGPFIGQLGNFLADFGGVLTEFQRRAGDVADLLSSRETGVVLTTTATDFSAREAKDFIDVLKDRRMNVDGVILNRVDPPAPPMPNERLLRTALEEQLPAPVDTTLHRVVQVYQDVRAQADRAHRVQADLEASHPAVPVCTLERLWPPPTGLDALFQMGAGLLRTPSGPS